MADASPPSEEPREVELTLVTMEFRSAKPAVVVLQTCKGDLSIERWAEICQTK